MPIGIILVIGFVVSRNIHRCGVRLLTSLVFVRDKTPTIRSPVFPSTKLPPVLFLFSTRKSGRNFFTRNIKPRLRSIDPPSYSLRREMRFKKKSMKNRRLKNSFFSRRINRECWNVETGNHINPPIPLTYSIGWNRNRETVCIVS